MRQRKDTEYHDERNFRSRCVTGTLLPGEQFHFQYNGHECMMGDWECTLHVFVVVTSNYCLNVVFL